MKFKKGQLTKESLKVIEYDIECLDDILRWIVNSKDKPTSKILIDSFKRSKDRLKVNLKDIWGLK